MKKIPTSISASRACKKYSSLDSEQAERAKNFVQKFPAAVVGV
jgi:hypothetical protein